MIDYDGHSLGVSTVHIGTDHAGFEMKNEIVKWLEIAGYEVQDHGAFEYDAQDDFTDYCAPVAKAVALDHASRGIIIGGSGQGEAIVANRFPNVRAVVFNGQYQPLDGREVPEEIITSRQHNDSNILSLGARFLNSEEALEATETWLETDFSGEERHIRRIRKIELISSTLHSALEGEGFEN
jgi:ribose 5-phosphate isomerase B